MASEMNGGGYEYVPQAGDAYLLEDSILQYSGKKPKSSMETRERSPSGGIVTAKFIQYNRV